MTLVRYRPFGRNLTVADDVNQMLESFFQSAPGTASGPTTWSPPCEVGETESGYTVRAEVPGVGRDAIKINLVNNTLVIQGEKKQQADETAGEWHHSERTWGSFERRIALPVRVDGARITARVTDGVLEVTIPKSDEARAREIKIES